MTSCKRAQLCAGGPCVRSIVYLQSQEPTPIFSVIWRYLAEMTGSKLSSTCNDKRKGKAVRPRTLRRRCADLRSNCSQIRPKRPWADRVPTGAHRNHSNPEGSDAASQQACETQSAGRGRRVSWEGTPDMSQSGTEIKAQAAKTDWTDGFFTDRLTWICFSLQNGSIALQSFWPIHRSSATDMGFWTDGFAGPKDRWGPDRGSVHRTGPRCLVSWRSSCESVEMLWVVSVGCSIDMCMTVYM